MKTNKLFAISMMALAALSFSACDPTNTPEPGNESGKVKGDDAQMVAICEDWVTSRQYWEWSEAFLFGPATTYSIDPHIDTWPFNETTFNNLLSKYHPASNELDAEVIDESVAFTQNLTGFHALEYLIFRDGAARKVADLSADELYFAKAVAADLQLASIKLVSAWGGDVTEDEQTILDDEEWEAERNYGEYFKTMSGTDAAVAIIEGARDIIGEVNEMKIGAPHTGADTKYIESPHAYNSIQDFYDNILSCQHALYGALNATEPLDGSLIAYTKNVKQYQEQTTKVVDALNTSLAKIKAMKAPFVKEYADASAGEAMDALGVLDDELKALEDLLNANSGNATQEEKLAATRDQFVEKTVLPTYRGLADASKTLAEALDKLEYAE